MVQSSKDDLENKLNRLALDVNEKAIFFAKKAKNTVNLNPKFYKPVIMYENVMLNIGNGLNATSGEFKAPFTGNYYFYASSVSQPGQKAELRQNGKAIISKTVPSSKNSDIWFPNELQATLMLVSGDTVSVHFEAKESYFNSVNNQGVTFTGFLLRHVRFQPRNFRTKTIQPKLIDPITPDVDSITPEIDPITSEADAPENQ